MERAEEFRKKFKGKPIPRPEHWGGFVIAPNQIEFWQHLDDRLHDRIKYDLQNDGNWMRKRLAP